MQKVPPPTRRAGSSGRPRGVTRRGDIAAMIVTFACTALGLLAVCVLVTLIGRPG